MVWTSAAISALPTVVDRAVATQYATRRRGEQRGDVVLAERAVSVVDEDALEPRQSASVRCSRPAEFNTAGLSASVRIGEETGSPASVTPVSPPARWRPRAGADDRACRWVLGRESGARRHAAARHVAERGYDGTNLGDIASELEISKGTIVHHFTSKDRMLAEAHERYMHRRIAEARVIVTALRTPSERLAGLILAGLLYQHEDRSATIAFQREVNRFRDDDVMRDSQQLRADYLAILVSVLDNGIADGSFRPVDAKVVARAIMSVNQWAWTWYEPDAARPPETVAAQFNDLFQGGLVNDRTTLPEPSALSDHIAPVVRSIIAAQPSAA